MSTRLYNTQQNIFISEQFENGYYVDGIKPILPDNIVELTIIYDVSPEITEWQKTTPATLLDLEQKTFTYTYNIVNLTPEEIQFKRNQEAESINEYVDMSIVKEMAKATVVDLENNIDKYISIYDYYIVGKSYEVNDIVQYENELYEIIQAHTSQHDWKPDILPALYRKIRVTLSPWVQPQGAHDAYNIGDKVTHNGSTWESTINANVWAPGVYGWIQI